MPHAKRGVSVFAFTRVDLPHTGNDHSMGAFGNPGSRKNHLISIVLDLTIFCVHPFQPRKCKTPIGHVRQHGILLIRGVG